MEKQLSIKDTSWRDAPTILTTAVGQIPWKVPGTSLVLYWRDVVEFYPQFGYQAALVDEHGQLVTFNGTLMLEDDNTYYFTKPSEGGIDMDTIGIETLVEQLGEIRVDIEEIENRMYRIVGSDYVVDLNAAEFFITPEPSDYNP